MTSISEIIKSHCVVVNEGSGVLIQPMTVEYSYILTAAHNLREDPKKPQSNVINVQDIKLYTYSDQAGTSSLVAQKFYIHDTLDIAIIQIDFYANLSLGICHETIMLGDDVHLYGYPRTRRRADRPIKDWVNSHSLVVQDHATDKITLRNKSSASKGDIDGFSGGGIFHINDAQDQAFLIGIEYAMANPNEEHDWLVVVPILRSSEIIEQYGLAPIKPYYLASFESLTDRVFPQSYYEHLADFKWQKFNHVIDILKATVKQISTEIPISPNAILEENLDNLKVIDQAQYKLEDPKLWTAILELITIQMIVSDVKMETKSWSLYINALFQDYRFIYIDTEKTWEAHYEEIVTVNTDHLKESGKIILILGSQPMPSAIVDSAEIEEVIFNITRPMVDELIDNANRINKQKYTMIHWLSLHDQCIFQNADDFKKYIPAMLKKENMKLIKQYYMPYLGSKNS